MADVERIADPGVGAVMLKHMLTGEGSQMAVRSRRMTHTEREEVSDVWTDGQYHGHLVCRPKFD